MRECTHNGRPFRILNVIDEYTRECLATRVARQLDGGRCAGVPDPTFLSAGRATAFAVGQWTRVHGEKDSEVVERVGGEHLVYRARQSLGEWLCRIVQWQNAG